MTPHKLTKLMFQKVKYTFLFCLIIFSNSSFFVPAETIQVRLFSHLKVLEVQTVINLGMYDVIADGETIMSSKPLMSFTIKYKNDSIDFYLNDKIIGTYNSIKLVSNGGCEIKLRLTNPERKIRTYQDDFNFSVSEGGIRIINDIVLDNYIAGVTEAEAGSKSSPEFYKVQAILARTFALAHINKHALEGYSLCDRVHCQAYYGKPRDLSIFKAMESTKGKVVVDDNLNLIIASFHSNSGGQTANSEDVWGAYTSYLRSTNDSFSVNMPNYLWERRMLTDDWLSYLKLKHNYPVENSEEREAALNFTQENRKIYLESPSSKVPLKNVRLDLQLKSTFFNITPLGKDSVLFSGKGYGHGLGMCQEGAMNMVKKGYSYTQVLNFYYQNITLIDLHKLSFFKDE